MNRGNPWCVLLASALFLLGSTAQASDEVLTFRQSSAGGIEAVVSGRNDGPGCAPEFVAPSSVVVNDAVVTITSPDIAESCTLPLPPVPYEVVADLGVLTGDRYDVTWEQGPLSVSAVLIPAAVVGGPTASIPALSLAGILALMLSVAASVAFFGANLTRRRSRSVAG